MFANTEVSAAQVLCPERRTTLRLTVLAMSIAIAFNAWGQEAAGGAAPSDTVPASVSPTADSQKMHEVIVTAQKRKQSIQKTPIAMSAVSGDEIAEKAENTIDSVLKTMPSVEVQGHAQGAQVYIRGVGSSIDPSFADPAIALMVDGSYLGRTESAVSGTFDVERVEVLRGPQGTLYGRNASGGVVNVLTVNPILGKFEGNVRVQLGDYALRRGETALNIPLGSVSAMRIAAFSERHRGYVDDGSMDAHDEGIRIKWRIDPIEGWSLVAKAEYYAEHANGSNTVPVPGSAGQLTFPPPLFTTNFDPTITAGPPFTGGAPIWRFPNGWVTKGSDAWSNDPDHPAGHVDRTAKTISAQLDGDLKFASLTVLPSYTVDHNDLLSSFLFGTLTGPYIWGRSVMKYTSVEARLNSLPTSPIAWMLGLYHYDAKSTGPNDDLTQDSYVFSQVMQPTRTSAVFGQLTYPVTDQFRLTGGLRFSRDANGQTFQITNTANGVSSSGGFNQSVSSKQYKVGFEYDLAKDALLYAHLATGFKQGGLSPSVPAVPYKPENLKAYELGVKSRVLDNRVQLNGAIFYYDYKNYQVSYLQSVMLGNTGTPYTSPVVANAKSPGKNAGAELGADWKISRDSQFRLSLTYLNATYGDVTEPNNPFVNQGDYSLKGHVMQNSPRWSGTFGYEHSIDFAGGTLTAGITNKLSSDYFVSPEQYVPGAHQGGYSRTDLSLHYVPMGDGWSLTGWVKNVENRAQTTYVFPAYRRLVTAPRTLGISAEYHF